MPKIVPIVEGPGEVEAVPALLWKLLAEIGRYDIQIDTPQNAHGCGNLTKPGGIEKFVENAWTKRNCGAVLVLMDADKKCPVQLATDFSRRILALGVRFPVVIVIAKREYEAWFLASLAAIAGKPWQNRVGLPPDVTYDDDSERIAGVKGWLDRHLPPGHSYKPAQDQAVLTAMLDLELTREKSRSFRRLCHALEQAVEAIDTGSVAVTPQLDETPQGIGRREQTEKHLWEIL